MLKSIFDFCKDSWRGWKILIRVVWSVLFPDPWKLIYWTNLNDKALRLGLTEITDEEFSFKCTGRFGARVWCARKTYAQMQDISDILADYETVRLKLVQSSKWKLCPGYEQLRLLHHFGRSSGWILAYGSPVRLTTKLLRTIGALRYNYFFVEVK